MSAIKGIRTSVAGGLVASALILVGTLPSLASAQDVDNRWLPWLGCWEASEGGSEIPMLCVSPLPEMQGVELTTWSEGKTISTEAIYTDGEIRDASREGCEGMEEAWFSDSGNRVYLKSQYICDGGTQRGATGLLSFANSMEWLDIKVVEVAGNQVPMVMRYRLARTSRVAAAGMDNIVAPRAMAVRSARIAASAPLTPQDLIEASSQVDSKAVEALIAERGDQFDVNADMLIQLADANVSPEVIDLAVAVSYPERFAIASGVPESVERDEEAMQRMSPMYTTRGYYGLRSRWSFWDPYYYDPFYYSPYGYSYSPYYYNYGGYGGYYRPTSVIVYSDPNPEYEGNTHGRVINGRGYSRGGSSSVGSGGSYNPSTRTTPSSSRGSGVSSSGRSSGGSSVRSAKPRGGTSAPARSSVSSSSGSRSSSSTAARAAKRRGGSGLF